MLSSVWNQRTVRAVRKSASSLGIQWAYEGGHSPSVSGGSHISAGNRHIALLWSASSALCTILRIALTSLVSALNALRCQMSFSRGANGERLTPSPGRGLRMFMCVCCTPHHCSERPVRTGHCLLTARLDPDAVICLWDNSRVLFCGSPSMPFVTYLSLGRNRR